MYHRSVGLPIPSVDGRACPPFTDDDDDVSCDTKNCLVRMGTGLESPRRATIGSIDRSILRHVPPYVVPLLHHQLVRAHETFVTEFGVEALCPSRCRTLRGFVLEECERRRSVPVRGFLFPRSFVCVRSKR
jgi:hypothetical protein